MNIEVASQIAVLNPDNQIMTACVTQGNHWGKMVFPGGRQTNTTESPEKTARRELFEESALHCYLSELKQLFRNLTVLTQYENYHLTAYVLRLPQSLRAEALSFEASKKTSWFWANPHALFDLDQYGLLLPTTQVILKALINQHYL